MQSSEQKQLGSFPSSETTDATVVDSNDLKMRAMRCDGFTLGGVNVVGVVVESKETMIMNGIIAKVVQRSFHAIKMVGCLVAARWEKLNLLSIGAL